MAKKGINKVPSPKVSLRHTVGYEFKHPKAVVLPNVGSEFMHKTVPTTCIRFDLRQQRRNQCDPRKVECEEMSGKSRRLFGIGGLGFDDRLQDPPEAG